MRSSMSLVLLGVLAATQVAAQYDNASAPFNLIILSKNATINGTALFPGHEGAGIEALLPYDCYTPGVDCPRTEHGNSSLATYTFNYSSTDTGGPGYIIWQLPTSGPNGNTIYYPSALTFSYQPTTNVAVPLFFPGNDNAISLNFDKHDKLFVQGYIDDTTDPVTADGSVKSYYRWYLCYTYVGYPYTTLAWTMGDGKPENPSCQKVQVQRIFL